MSMLTRYKKAGGFKQLLNLLETCGPQKQEKFLELIDQEDPRWGAALRKKMVDIPRIFSWKDEVLAEIAIRLQELTLGTALHGFDQTQRGRLLKMFSPSQKRKIDDVFSSRNPTPPEISTMMMKIIEHVRSMITDGSLRVQDFDPDLVIDSSIEENISKEAITTIEAVDSTIQTEDGTTLNFHLDDAGEAVPAMKSGEASSKDAEMLRMKVNTLLGENKKLKTQIKGLQDRLDQIKRIA